MKLQPLFIALALATGASFAQAPSGGTKAPEAPAASSSQAADQAPAPMKKKSSHKKHATAKHHASAKKAHEEHMASPHHHGTHAMGAGAATPVTDLNASSREHRMDQAYTDWQARQKR